MKVFMQTVAFSCAIALLAVVLLPLAGCSAYGSKPVRLSYSNTDYGFSITRSDRYEDVYPFVAGDLRFKVGFFDKDGAAPVGGGMPGGLWVAGIGEKQRSRLAPDKREALLDELVRDYAKQGKTKAADWGRTTIGDLPAAWLEDTDPQTNGKRLTYLVVGSKDIYVLVGLSSLALWEESRPLLVEAIESFREL